MGRFCSRLLFCVLCLLAGSGGAKEHLRLAVLDFQAPAQKEWMGTAVAESLTIKLAAADGVSLLERKEWQALAVAASREEITPSRLGVDWLVQGQVQVVADRCRIAARLVKAGSGRIAGESACVVDGALGEWFALEEQLATALARAMGLELSLRAARYHQARTTEAERLYAEALLHLQAAEKEAAQSPVPPELSKRVQAIVEQFRQAQTANAGAFFAAAHHGEARARDLLAQIQKDPGQREQVRLKTVARFRKDAAAAAPAFYDLGRALEDGRDYSEAMKAYEDYIRWYDQSARPYRWESPRLAGGVVLTEEGRNQYDQGKRVYDQYTSMAGSPSMEDNFRPWVIHEGAILYRSAKEGLVCHDLETEKVRWKQNRLPRTSRTSLLTVRDGYVVYGSGQALVLLDPKSGKVRQEIPLKERINLGTRLVTLPGLLVLKGAKAIRAWPIDGGAQERWSYSLPQSSRALAVSQGDLFVAPGGVLTRISGQTGTVVKTWPLKDACQIWRGEKHLLVRATVNALRANQDRFYRLDPTTNALEQSTTPLHYSYIYNQLPAEGVVLPLTEQRKGIYRLVPAPWLLGMTRTDQIDKASGIYRSEEVLPWCSLDSNRLALWTQERVVRCYDLPERKLTWRMLIPSSKGSVGLYGNHLVVRTDRRQFSVYRTDASVAAYTAVQAYIRKARCLVAMGRHMDALETLKTAVRNDGSSVEAHRLIASIHQRLGNQCETAEAFLEVLRFDSPNGLAYREAADHLKKRIGLKALLRTSATSAMMIRQGRLYVEHARKGRDVLEAYHVETGQWDKDTSRQPGGWTITNDRLVQFFPSRLYPLGNINYVYASYSPPSPEAVAAVEKQPDTGSRIDIRPLDEDKAPSSFTFKGFDNRWVRPGIQQPGRFGSGAIQWPYLAVGLQDKRLGVFDLTTGKQRWDRSVPGCVYVLLHGDALFTTTVRQHGRHEVACYEISSGKERWRQSFVLNRKPGLLGGGGKSHAREQSSIGAFLAATDKTLCVSYLLSSFGAFWSDPCYPLFFFDLKTGESRGRVASNLTLTSCSLRNERPVFGFTHWTYSSQIAPPKLWPFTEERMKAALQGPDYRFRPGDLWNTHPLRLARLPGLEGLGAEQSLADIADALNQLVEDPARRKQWIAQNRGRLKPRKDSSNPMICRCMALLKTPQLTERQEKEVVRSAFMIMDLREPRSRIFGFAHPHPIRLESLLPVRDNRGQSTGGFLGCYLQHIHFADARGQIHGRPWSLPDFGNVDLLVQEGNVFACRSSRGGILLFDLEGYRRFVTGTTRRSGLLFAYGSSDPLGRLTDKETATTVRFAPDAFVGFDFGWPSTLNQVRVTPAGKTDLPAMWVQGGSTNTFRAPGPHAVTGPNKGFVNLGQLKKDGTFGPIEKAYRYYRLRPVKPVPMELAEIRMDVSEKKK